MNRIFFSLGALLAGVSVAAGAYGAHAGDVLSAEQASWIEKAVRYQMYHALALIAVSLAMVNWPKKMGLLTIAGSFFLLGTVCFSGSLYWMASGGENLGYIVPTGGVSFIVGWLLLASAALRAE